VIEKFMGGAKTQGVIHSECM